MNDPEPTAKPYMMAMRDLNMETSLRVFLGDYISDEGAQEISDKYWLITLALQLVNFPLALPGTNVWNAIKARKIAMKHLTAAAGASKKRMAEGGESNCLLDAWISEMISARAGDGDEDQKRVLSREYSDHEIAMVVLSFLFASQDAMTSAIIYLFQLMADHPEILAKVREEQYRIRGADIEGPTSLDMVDDMVYTRACIKESLRLMPPVIMVSLAVVEEYQIVVDHFPLSRCPTLPRKRSRSRKTTRRRLELWSFRRSGIHCTTRLSTRNPTSSFPNVGCHCRKVACLWLNRVLKTTWCGEVDRTRYADLVLRLI